MNHKYGTALIFLCMIYAQLQAIIRIHGDNGARGFINSIISKVLHKPTGTFYVGLASDGSATTKSFAISKAARPSPSSSIMPKFQPLGRSGGAIFDKNIRFLTLATTTSTPTTLAFSPGLKTVGASTTDGITSQESAPLKDDTETDELIVANLAANENAIVAALSDTDASTHERDLRGLGSVQIIKKSDGTFKELRIKDANTGLDGNRAIQFDGSISQIKGDSAGSSDVQFLTDIDDPIPGIVWDEKLKRFYVGVSIETAGNANDIAKAVVVVKEDAGKLTLFPIAPDDAITSIVTDEIIVLKNPPNSEIIRVIKLAVMHTSTGPDYLIINGGIEGEPANADTSAAIPAEQGSVIWALPLVNLVDDPDNPIQGTLAKKDAELEDFKFVIPATVPGDLANYHDDPFVLVGGGAIPIYEDTVMAALPLPSNEFIADMHVDGDTVYVAIEGSRTETQSPGIYYSQALFDAAGKISGWTPWTHAAVPPDAFVSAATPTADGFGFVDADLVTGSLWAVSGNDHKQVGVTSWKRHTAGTSLPAQLNILLPGGVYSALDLDQGTRSFFRRARKNGVPATTDNAIKHRYALFGGSNTVIFMRTSEVTHPGDQGQNALTAADPQSDIVRLGSAQKAITDFELLKNSLITNLPENAGPVRHLEYSRRNEIGYGGGEQDALDPQDPPVQGNYFFAGTDSGLFVFSHDGSPIHTIPAAAEPTDTFGPLDTLPFNVGSWSKINTVRGSVVDIKTSGRALYVLVTSRATADPTKRTSTLYAFTYQNDVDSTFDLANRRILAETGIGIFEDTDEFFSTQIISTGNPDDIPDSEEQLLLATNNGLFKSDADQTDPETGIISAADQDAANWQFIDNARSALYPIIEGINTPIRYTTWPIRLSKNFGCNIFGIGDVLQISGGGIREHIEIDPVISDVSIPEEFNAQSNSKSLLTLDRIQRYWSDGARRFFVLNPTKKQGDTLNLIPFFADEWRVNAPSPVRESLFDRVKTIYWISPIGITGYLLAGTNCGVLSLE